MANPSLEVKNAGRNYSHTQQAMRMEILKAILSGVCNFQNDLEQ